MGALLRGPVFTYPIYPATFEKDDREPMVLGMRRLLLTAIATLLLTSPSRAQERK